MAWTLLIVAVFLEVLWASSLKATDGYTRLWPSVFNITVLVANLYILAQVFRVLPSGTAYAIWTGLGAAGVAAVGVFIYGESAAFSRLFFLFLIVAGVAGLKYVTPS